MTSITKFVSKARPYGVIIDPYCAPTYRVHIDDSIPAHQSRVGPVPTVHSVSLDGHELAVAAVCDVRADAEYGVGEGVLEDDAAAASDVDRVHQALVNTCSRYFGHSIKASFPQSWNG